MKARPYRPAIGRNQRFAADSATKVAPASWNIRQLLTMISCSDERISHRSSTFKSPHGVRFVQKAGAGSGCAWTASINASWLTIASGSTGSGNGEVQYGAAATTGPARSGTLTIAGRTFTLNQGEGCAFMLSPTSTTINDDGGQGSFTVQTGSGCG